MGQDVPDKMGGRFMFWCSASTMYTGLLCVLPAQRHEALGTILSAISPLCNHGTEIPPSQWDVAFLQGPLRRFLNCFVCPSGNIFHHQFLKWCFSGLEHGNTMASPTDNMTSDLTLGLLGSSGPCPCIILSPGLTEVGIQVLK